MTIELSLTFCILGKPISVFFPTKLKYVAHLEHRVSLLPIVLSRQLCNEIPAIEENSNIQRLDARM